MAEPVLPPDEEYQDVGASSHQTHLPALTASSCWGYTFEHTDEHPTPEQYQPLKYTYDIIAEQVLDRLNVISPPIQKKLPR